MSASKIFALFFAILALVPVGCATVDGETRGESDSQSKPPPPKGADRLPDDNFDPTGLDRRDIDLNRDTLPDAYQFAQVKDGELIVVRKEVDVNFDGKIDLVRMFDENGELITERLDTDFDGRVDVVNVFESGNLARKEYDTNFDSVTDLWRYFEGGVIARKEADLDHNGQVDYWEYYEKGQIDRVGVDLDGDGSVDQWTTANAS